MDLSKAAIVVGITLLIVILFNLAIFSTFGKKRGDKNETIDMLSRAFKTARDPWKGEDNDLQELSERVDALKKRKEEETK
jgi:hypothetical protein